MKIDLAGPEEYRRRDGILVATGTYLLIAVAVFSTYVMTSPEIAKSDCRLLPKIALLLSGVFPPVWFWAEFIFIWNKAPDDHRPKFDKFQYGQQLSQKIWTCFALVILALYFK